MVFVPLERPALGGDQAGRVPRVYRWAPENAGRALRNSAVRKPEGISAASPFSFEPRSDRLDALDEPGKCRDVRLPARDVLHGFPEREPLVAAEIRHGDGGRPADPGVAEEIDVALPDLGIDPANGLLQLPGWDWLHIRDWHLVGWEAGVGERMLLGDVQKRIGPFRGRLGLCLGADGKVLVDKPGGFHVCWWGRKRKDTRAGLPAQRPEKAPLLHAEASRKKDSCPRQIASRNVHPRKSDMLAFLFCANASGKDASGKSHSAAGRCGWTHVLLGLIFAAGLAVFGSGKFGWTVVTVVLACVGLWTREHLRSPQARRLDLRLGPHRRAREPQKLPPVTPMSLVC